MEFRVIKSERVLIAKDRVLFIVAETNEFTLDEKHIASIQEFFTSLQRPEFGTFYVELEKIDLFARNDLIKGPTQYFFRLDYPGMEFRVCLSRQMCGKVQVHVVCNFLLSRSHHRAGAGSHGHVERAPLVPVPQRAIVEFLGQKGGRRRQSCLNRIGRSFGQLFEFFYIWFKTYESGDPAVTRWQKAHAIAGAHVNYQWLDFSLQQGGHNGLANTFAGRKSQIKCVIHSVIQSSCLYCPRDNVTDMVGLIVCEIEGRWEPQALGGDGAGDFKAIVRCPIGILGVERVPKRAVTDVSGTQGSLHARSIVNEGVGPLANFSVVDGSEAVGIDPGAVVQTLPIPLVADARLGETLRQPFKLSDADGSLEIGQFEIVAHDRMPVIATRVASASALVLQLQQPFM